MHPVHHRLMLSNQQFDRARGLALKLAGIVLVDRHRELLDRRSRRLGVLDSAGLDGLLAAAEKGEPTAVRKLVCLVTTKFSGFFRHPEHFRVAAEHTLEAVRQRGCARLWSAGAATGEEPYSLAMVLIEACKREDPPTTILASDVDAEALVAARRGEYGAEALRAVELSRRQRFLIQTGDLRRYSIAPIVRRLVEFRMLNLAEENWLVEGPFDVIFCRNVLMYLESRRRYAVLERMASLLAPDGLVMLDPAEHLGEAGHLFTGGTGAIYSRRHESRHAATPHCAPTGVEM